MPVCASASHQPARAPIDFAGEIRDPFTLEKRERRVDGGGSSPVGDPVLIEISGGVADVRLNRPDKMNALDGAMFEAIVAAGERLRREPGLRAVVFGGAGRGFGGGMDRGRSAWRGGGRPDPVFSDLETETNGKQSGA